VTVGDKLELVCVKASIILEKDGKITITGTDIMVTASGQAEIHGATVKITSDPLDLN
jgi:type VI secretion system secreted protein VgrG